MGYNFRRIRDIENSSDILRISPTDLSKCPIILRKKKEGTFEYSYSDYTKKIFEKGNKIHQLTGIFRNGARSFIDKETHMTIIQNDNKFIFSGYSDFIMVNENGLYLEDLKTCDRKAFYHFNEEEGSTSEKLQLSGYRLLYYVIHGVDIEHSVITKIDRDNSLNRISLEVETFTPAQMEEYLLNHPTIQVMLGEISDRAFMMRSKAFIRQNSWLCRYCSDSKECNIFKTINKQNEKANAD